MVEDTEDLWEVVAHGDMAVTVEEWEEEWVLDLPNIIPEVHISLMNLIKLQNKIMNI